MWNQEMLLVFLFLVGKNTTFLSSVGVIKRYFSSDFQNILSGIQKVLGII